jgi:hypothetical protein
MRVIVIFNGSKLMHYAGMRKFLGWFFQYTKNGDVFKN